jgi:hypothetical protein
MVQVKAGRAPLLKHKLCYYYGGMLPRLTLFETFKDRL